MIGGQYRVFTKKSTRPLAFGWWSFFVWGIIIVTIRTKDIKFPAFYGGIFLLVKYNKVKEKDTWEGLRLD